MLSKAGLRKLTIMGRKVKVEFLLQDLPAAGGKGSCRLRYLLGGQEKEKSWDIVFVSGGRQMHFLQKLEEAEEMERETVTGNSEITAWSRCLGSAYLQCLLHVNRKYGRGGIRRGGSGVL